jgi:hypothetical protein
MTMHAPAMPRLAAPLLALLFACIATGCGSKAPPTADAVVATQGAAAADACEKLQARIAHCKANMKNGKFEIKFDPGAEHSPGLCQQTNQLVDSVAQMSGCESG